VTSHTKPSIIILGAGLAGLSAAYSLQKKGYGVTIIEGRDRVGGRIDTRLVDKEENLSIEMGAEWIGKKHQRMLDLCAHFHLPLIIHRLRTHLIYKGKYFKPNQWKLSQGWQDRIQKIVHDFPQMTKEQLEELNSKDWWHFLLRNHIPQRDLEIMNLFESTDYGESIRFTSALEVITDMFSGGDTGLECFYRIGQGNSCLPNALAKEIGSAHIHLNKIVKKIHQEKGKVEITCADDSTYTADKIIVSLPASALTKIQWTPHLPANKNDAIWSLNYSRILKVALLFKNRFWKAETFEMITDQLPQYIYHATQNQPGKKGVLTSYSVGSRAEILARMPEEQRVEEFLRTIEIPFGKVGDKIEKVISYYWAEDPFTQGAYALYEKNLRLDCKEILASPFENIFFCGEHTAVNQGFMEGALESAERVVKELTEET
jgi:monoamine oxidase